MAAFSKPPVISTLLLHNAAKYFLLFTTGDKWALLCRHKQPCCLLAAITGGIKQLLPDTDIILLQGREEAALPDGKHVQLQLNEWSASALVHIRVFRTKTSQLSEINWPEVAENYGSLFAWRICWFSQKWQVACQRYRLMDMRISCSPRSERDCVVTLTCNHVRAVCTLTFSSYSTHRHTAQQRQREEEPRDEKEEKERERETNWLFGG